MLTRDLMTDIHLVVCASTPPADLRKIHKGFQPLSINRILWTKLDEASTFGSMFNGQVLTQAPISYLSVGQQVPEDLETATPGLVTRLILKSTDFSK